MSWVKLDDMFPRHRRVQHLHRDVVAKWLHIVALCYCAEHLTDGRIDEVALRSVIKDADVPRSAATRCVPKLVECGLWVEHDQGGFVIRDYLDYNPTAAETRAKREARAAAGRLGGLRSGEARREANASPPVRALSNPVPVLVPQDQVLYRLPVETVVDNSLRSVNG